MYSSKYCEVSYLQNKNAVFCKWKSYCEGKDYQEPLEYGLELANKTKQLYRLLMLQMALEAKKVIIYG